MKRNTARRNQHRIAPATVCTTLTDAFALIYIWTHKSSRAETLKIPKSPITDRGEIEFQPSIPSHDFELTTAQSFERYIEFTQRKILRKRSSSLHNSTYHLRGQIITQEERAKLASPFIIKPSQSCQGKPRRGAVLMHGLFETPFYMQDLGIWLRKKCVLVYSFIT